MSPSFLVQKLIGKMQFPGLFSANCGQDCGIPRGIVKHSFGNQIYIQCKLPLVAQNSFNRISKNIEMWENQNIFKEFFLLQKVYKSKFLVLFYDKSLKNVGWHTNSKMKEIWSFMIFFCKITYLWMLNVWLIFEREYP